MRKTAVLRFSLFLLPLPFTGLLLCQESTETAEFAGVFAYAINSTQLLTISNGVTESSAQLLTQAVCPTHAISSPIRLSRVRNADGAGRSGFQYDADKEVPAGSYCLLVDLKAHEKLLVWGSSDTPTLLHEKKCLSEIAEKAESLTGRKAASCYIIGGYGTGSLRLVEYAHNAPEDRLSTLMVIDHSLPDGTSRYSIVRFPATSPVWASDKDGNFHPERFRHLFTISDDPDSKLWLTAIEWTGPGGNDLVLYQPVGTELRPILINHDSFHRLKKPADIASR